MRTNNLYEAIIDFCRIMAIFILFSIIVNLFSSCEDKVEEQCDYREDCFIVVEAEEQTDGFYLFIAENLCSGQRYYLNVKSDSTSIFVFNDKVYCDGYQIER